MSEQSSSREVWAFFLDVNTVNRRQLSFRYLFIVLGVRDFAKCFREHPRTDA